jgi:NAD(P)-dependent dehydrogenase (short-subunit alcohol dehydrogenase family)
VQAFEKVVALNLLAAFSLTRLALPLLEATATLGNPARVINIGKVMLLGEQLLLLALLSPILPPPSFSL